MARQYVETRYTESEVKSMVASQVANGLSQRKLEALYCIYGFNPYEPWVRINHLLSAISRSKGYELEEAARVLIDPNIIYADGEGKFYTYG